MQWAKPSVACACTPAWAGAGGRCPASGGARCQASSLGSRAATAGVGAPRVSLPDMCRQDTKPQVVLSQGLKRLRDRSGLLRPTRCTEVRCYTPFPVLFKITFPCTFPRRNSAHLPTALNADLSAESCGFYLKTLFRVLQLRSRWIPSPVQPQKFNLLSGYEGGMW